MPLRINQVQKEFHSNVNTLPYTLGQLPIKTLPANCSPLLWVLLWNSQAKVLLFQQPLLCHHSASLGTKSYRTTFTSSIVTLSMGNRKYWLPAHLSCSIKQKCSIFSLHYWAWFIQEASQATISQNYHVTLRRGILMGNAFHIYICSVYHCHSCFPHIIHASTRNYIVVSHPPPACFPILRMPYTLHITTFNSTTLVLQTNLAYWGT